jgi:peptidoglycan/LPS O-acetylase OafA/YrhL
VISETPSDAHRVVRLDQLTGLRFAAAFGVLLCHYAAVLGLPLRLRFLTDFFGSGVALFFVLSGFVLTHNYQERLAPPRARGALQEYFVARGARVLPVYWLCLLGILALYLRFGFGLSLGAAADEAGKPLSFAINALALQAWWPDWSIQQYWNAPAWSVSSELFFYVCFPWLLRSGWLDGSVRSFAWLWALMAAALASALGVWFQIRHLAPSDEVRQVWLLYTVRCPLFGLYCFALGLHLARAARRSRNGGATAGAMAGATLAIVLAAWAVAWQKPQHVLGSYVEICAIYLVYTPYFYLLIRFLISRRSALAAWFARPGAVLLGDSSYALYLLHWLPLCVLLNLPGPLHGSLAAAWLTAGALVAASIAVFRWFEAPLRRVIRRRFSAAALA